MHQVLPHIRCRRIISPFRKKPRLLIFDFDGVLAESTLVGDPIELLTQENYLARLSQHSEKVMAALKALSQHKFQSSNWLWEFYNAGVDIRDRRLLAEISTCIYELSISTYRLLPGVQEMVLELKAQRKELAIDTDNCRRTVKDVLGALLRNFSHVITYENVSNLKYSPEGILSICRAAKVHPRQAAMIGDKPVDEKTALSAGMGMYIMATWARSDPLRFADPNRTGWIGKTLYVSSPQMLLEVFGGRSSF